MLGWDESAVVVVLSWASGGVGLFWLERMEAWGWSLMSGEAAFLYTRNPKEGDVDR
jgi:hypothetical protein